MSCIDTHQCVPIANLIVKPPRLMWLGRITAIEKECASETHCLHFIGGNGKRMVMLLNAGDASNLAAVAQIINGGPHDQGWLERHIDFMKSEEKIAEVELALAPVKLVA